jgi:hypothetical protein
VVLAATPVEGILEIAKCALSSSVTAERYGRAAARRSRLFSGSASCSRAAYAALAVFFVIPDFAALVPLAFTNAV